MQLSEEQIELIKSWAAGTPQIDEVWLYGSRAKGNARPDSDVDLAVRIAASDQRVGDYALGVYLSYSAEWQRMLSELLQLPAHVELKDGETHVSTWCDETGVRLFPSSAQRSIQEELSELSLI